MEVRRQTHRVVGRALLCPGYLLCPHSAVLHSSDENIIDLMRDCPKAYDFINEKITHTPGRLRCYINN